MSLYTLDKFQEKSILDLIKRANQFKNGLEVDYSKKIVGNLFFEPSTRTHYSFDIAAKRLKMRTINFTQDNSSLLKGETFEDTVYTFDQYGLDALVIRHQKEEYYKELNINTPIINAGDGSGNHPTQSLLDLMTIYNEFDKFKGLKILICGDIKHSRVAKTNIKVMKNLGMEVFLSAPKEFQDPSYEYCDLDEVIESVNIVMLLRVQFERHGTDFGVDYIEKYQFNEQRLEKLKDDAIIMHPGPYNIDYEITNEVVHSQQSRIFEQVNNGMYMRMAVLEDEVCS